MKTKKGKKRQFKNPQEYRAYLRSQVRAGRGHTADGHAAPLSNSAMGKDLLAGYNFK